MQQRTFASEVRANDMVAGSRSTFSNQIFIFIFKL